MLAIAVSPESLQMLVANSIKKAIPVIFINRTRNSLLIAVLFDILVSKLIIAPILSITKTKIKIPAANETYIVNSGLYCLIIIIIINILLSLWIIFSFNNSKAFLSILKETCYLWITVLVPSILPMYFFSNLLLINERLFNTADEKVKQSVFSKMFKTDKAYKGEVISPESGGFISDDNLFNYQAKVVKELAERENCVIVGRCADYALANHPNCINVFVKANMDYRIKLVSKRSNLTESKAKDMILKQDKQRASYYNYYTSKKWGDSKSYDLCLDSSKLGIDGCVDMILKFKEIIDAGNK